MDAALETRPHRPSLGSAPRPTDVDMDVSDAGVSTLAEAALATSPHKIDPALDPSLPADPGSPKAERLPSFRQLSRLAAAGEETGTQPVNADGGASPTAEAGASLTAQSGPSFTQSPTSAFPECSAFDPQLANESPTSHAHQPLPAAQLAALANNIHPPLYPDNVPGAEAYASGPYFEQRRPSMTAYTAAPAVGPQPSSSSDTVAQTESVPERRSSLPAPTAVMSADPAPKHDENQQPLPAPAPPGTHVCQHPGCTAPPFQTPYLLNSHANVHSSKRPHFCTVAGCPRGPGGKGFKRKNEMIRHGLVHESPGYICPFCSDREHKYPRPDNLQRHVRVHHQDRDMDDPSLREVLSQRLDGVKSRRRRTGP